MDLAGGREPAVRPRSAGLPPPPPTDASTRAAEVVYLYENQGALVIAFSPSQHGHEGVCSLAVYADRVLLHFAKGAQRGSADPKRLLQGRATPRHVALTAPADLDHPEIEALLVAALALADVRPEARATEPGSAS